MCMLGGALRRPWSAPVAHGEDLHEQKGRQRQGCELPDCALRECLACPPTSKQRIWGLLILGNSETLPLTIRQLQLAP